MRVVPVLLVVFIFTLNSFGQDKKNAYGREKNKVSQLSNDSLENALKEVVVTGQYQPQSLRNSVYQTRIITAERIRLRAATNIQQVLNTELGFRFSNDLTLGTSDIQMMGMTGRNVKILLDGVPMVDRSDTRESLNQIDINTVDHIEIVEGPLSVSYGTDALAGVINIITKSAAKKTLNINARVQEETVGDTYSPFTKDGSHLQHVGAGWQNKGWNILGGVTHNDFGGFNVPGPLTTADEISANTNRWKPKEQWLANTKFGYAKSNFNVWYRLDYVDETIDSKGGYNPNNFKATNQQYITHRYSQQLHGDYSANDRLQLSGIVGYSNLERATKTFVHDYTNGSESLSTGAGEQDVSKFQSTNIRTTAQYKLTDQLSFQPGAEINLDNASGARIKGSPSISDYAFFISSELNLIKGVTIRPGLRFISNSVYDAPPVIPSINTKIRLNKLFDLRFGYASGFRSPALRELYYDFFDASHSIMGNEHLKAEQSNSFTGSLSMSQTAADELRFRSVLSAFYNNFRNRIDYGIYAADPTITTLINIAKYKTTGGTFENTLYRRDWQFSVGFSYIGTYNQYSESTEQYGESPEFVWSPEVNSNLTYTYRKTGTTANLAFKYTGRKPAYELATLDNLEQLRLSRIGAYTTADLMFTQRILESLSLNAGVKNLFDTKMLGNTALVTTAAHSTGGNVPLNYGRSYILGLSFNFNK
ncbi:outer membrane receptor for ferrienterochelin and colicins [Pedobacter westerhofensis]|uniref:Outer membrane receptor for ferrienterochelin and colicins n=1 Tax=Pedobacter westerhofensis TaxID=425512 RepID=A0A521FJZ9_9SPHI|nr:TonB-dependent receptor [Pedobacter westerhofensis]SMO96354.1 outer membrane receptor for ferrienterochelin and colicins [Pedobacter westerhofensis]